MMRSRTETLMKCQDELAAVDEAVRDHARFMVPDSGSYVGY